MSYQKSPLAAGLYLVATPIGTARDITLRALDVLNSADVLAAEDTRNLRHLMDIHGLKLDGRALLSYHDHNGPAMRPRILEHIDRGHSVAFVSDAGSPLIADPGYQLVQSVREAGHLVTVVPGASAVVAALILAGLPTDRFLFAGFPPASGGARRAFFAEFADMPVTLLFFESGKRLAASLKDMAAILGGERQIAICREMTKRFEEIRKSAISDMAAELAGKPLKGEIVMVVDRKRATGQAGDVVDELRRALKTMRTKEAAEEVAARLGLPRRQVYQMALKISDRASGE